MEALNFKLKRREVEINFEKEDGTLMKCLLVGISGSERDEYLAVLADRMRYDAQGKPIGVNSPAGLGGKLLQMALRDENGKRMSAKFIDDLPSEVHEALFDKAREISGLDSEDDDEVGNDSSEESG